MIEERRVYLTPEFTASFWYVPAKSLRCEKPGVWPGIQPHGLEPGQAVGFGGADGCPALASDVRASLHPFSSGSLPGQRPTPCASQPKCAISALGGLIPLSGLFSTWHAAWDWGGVQLWASGRGCCLGLWAQKASGLGLMLSGHWLEILNQFSFDLNVWQVKSGGIVSPGASARLPSHSPPWDRLLATCSPGPGTPEHHLASPSMPSQRPLLPPVPGMGRGSCVCAMECQGGTWQHHHTFRN